MTTTTDADLMSDYAARRDAEAFARLVDRYQRLVLATCRRRLHAAADVDDAVQETFLRLARSAAADGPQANLGGWLHRVAANVSADLNRRRSTRDRHETAAARPDLDAGASRELADLREHLDAALAKLEPDDRELIVQRFFVGRSQAELAATAGVTPSAVSRRLDKAVDALRQHLVALGCVAAAAGLVALLDAEQASAAVPPELTGRLTTIGLGGLPRTPRHRWRVGIGVAAVAGLVAVATWLIATAPLHAPARSRQATTAPAPVGLTVAGATGDLHQPALPPQWQPAGPPAYASAPLSGRIMDAGGQPIAGAEVQVRGPTNKDVRTNADGRYAVTDMQLGSHMVGATATGYLSVPWNGRGAPSLIVTDRTRAVRDFVLNRGVVVTVHVVNAAGRPLVNADINTAPATLSDRASTGRDGIAVLTLPQSPDPVTLMVGCDDHAPSEATVTPSDVNRPQTVRVALPNAMTVRGMAVCEDGKPAAGWVVYPEPAAWEVGGSPMPYSSRGTVGGDGRFRITDVGPGRWKLYLDKSARNEGEIIDLGTFDLPPADGVLWVTIPGRSPGSLPAITGRLRFTGPGGVPAYIDLQAIGHMTGGANRMELIDVTRNGAHTAAEAARDGVAFSIADVPPDTYKLRLSALEMDGRTVDDVHVPGPPLTLTLTIGGKPHLTGAVVGSDGKAVRRFAVRVKKMQDLGEGNNYGQDVQWQQVDDRGGRFDVELNSPGVYRAQVSADGYAWGWTTDGRVEHAGAVADVRVQLSAGGTLRGTVVDAAGRPVAGAKVLPLSESQAMFYTDPAFASDAGAVTADAAGRFELAHLTAGSETLRLTAAGYARAVASALMVRDGATTDAGPLRLPVGGSADGTVYDQEGQSAAGVTVDFQDTPNYLYDPEQRAAHVLSSVTTDAAGHFAVDHLPAVDVTAVVPRWKAACVVRRTIHPVEGRTARVDFGGPERVTGRLRSADGQPLSKVDVTLSAGDADFGPVLAESRTDADGRFTFAGPPAGTFTLFRLDEAAFNRRAAVTTVDVTGRGQDLGDVVEDVGSVVVRLSADDPADLARIAEVDIKRQHSDRWWTETVGYAGQPNPARPVWRAVDVPAGPMAVGVWFRGRFGEAVVVPFERKPGAGEMTVDVHIRRDTAAAQPTAPGKVPSDVRVRTWTTDGVLEVGSTPPTVTGAAGKSWQPDGRADDGWQFRLPAGDYSAAYGHAVQPFTFAAVGTGSQLVDVFGK